MDYTSIYRMFQRSSVIDSGGGVGGDSTNQQLHKCVKNIRLTHGQLKQQSLCKMRLVLLLLGLWMNLIAVTNGKWKIQLVKHMFFYIVLYFASFNRSPPTISLSFSISFISKLISFNLI